jgi:hypothetical protein
MATRRPFLRGPVFRMTTFAVHFGQERFSNTTSGSSVHSWKPLQKPLDSLALRQTGFF